MELTHAELERHHYNEVRNNPLYAMQGLMESQMEELSSNIPVIQETSDIEDRVGNLEAISAMPGQIPRRYYEQNKQLQGQVVYLQNALNAALDRGKKRQEARNGQQAKKEHQTKTTYKGLNVRT